ncbi:IMPACT family protein [Dermatophilus congolensis]|uniref:IMPACT family member yigZ n=1 Tax=Dermatophilus congolensis TaxID=1863 RepID=A0A239VJI4_9MICO|nr:YigZ family protein [Dermatophilus congolensis]MBO3129244.1 YigZ family protein [Dermatophilus congolensis]MBO3132124.1 YigZ family protein [Dermatophilus congolensis]MBO3133720.1 YigZ family protein [Dermatophilus congolensis]MBO3135951.1 YigZ family protein [Dermatophilus congolensis]MBO3138193.1 YigZ family protein [Dermatophilus congolensis]
MSERFYTTISHPTSAEIDVKNSRFLAHIEPVTDETTARAVIDTARREHWDARHHCSAFILGHNQETRRSSDDGEPSGTAGMPILETIAGHGLSNVVVVVTRWFGGTLLGTGGLVRAYTDATIAAIETAETITYAEGKRLRITTNMNCAGKTENALRAMGCAFHDVEYTTNNVTMLVDIRSDLENDVTEIVASTSSGHGTTELLGPTWSPIQNPHQ